ncbi:MAG TPA: hypothetical protein VGV13_02670 [Methylomirabilota bacterium]|jgi:hypothetical protein|nr:hypothetical protein [Methylomirabilota bacterium]
MGKICAALAIVSLLVPGIAARAQGPSLRGHVVMITDSKVIVRGDDGRTYTVNTAAVDLEELGALEPGHAVGVTTEGAGPTGGLIGGSSVTFEASDGTVLFLDLARIGGRRPAVEANAPATLIHESGPQGPVPVWIEPRKGRPAASGR